MDGQTWSWSFKSGQIYKVPLLEGSLKKGELPDGKIPTLTIVIKPTDNASYKNMVDALDEMQILSIGTYVIDKITPDDEKLLKSKNVEM